MNICISEKSVFSSNQLCVCLNSVFTFLITLARLEQFLCNTILFSFNYDELIILKSGRISWIFHFITNGKVSPVFCVLNVLQLIAESTGWSEKTQLFAIKQIDLFVNVWIVAFWKHLLVYLCLRASCSYLYPKQYIFLVVFLINYDQPQSFFSAIISARVQLNWIEASFLIMMAIHQHASAI